MSLKVCKKTTPGIIKRRWLRNNKQQIKTDHQKNQKNILTIF